MRTFALGAAAAATFLLGACGSGPAGTGGGGQGTGGATASSSSATTGTGAGTPCSTGADCSTCTTFADCVGCNGAKVPSAAAAFDAFERCVLCSTCSFQCQGAANSDYCGGQPVNPGACGLGPQDPQSCQDCITCAGTDTCASQRAACEADPDCKMLVDGVTCPMM